MPTKVAMGSSPYRLPGAEEPRLFFLGPFFQPIDDPLVFEHWVRPEDLFELLDSRRSLREVCPDLFIERNYYLVRGESSLDQMDVLEHRLHNPDVRGALPNPL